ncbi:SWIM zinc finger family protein [Bernardetia sp.]|uniref:SWIM zinc finger family protein n=1 Tax=Bernardetia sp. TaxID=1937974 RepID=UPI0025C219C0|nr:SWIM zinc finger family protein [Bernardetia sp.]
MKIHDFESHIETRFVDRGFHIYEQDYIQEIETIGKGEFTATVLGTTFYEIYVELDEEEVVDWNCTCPYDGWICKHVVAVLYYLRDSKMWREIPQSSLLREVEAIFDELSKQEIKEFMMDYLKRNKGFREGFLDEFRK